MPLNAEHKASSSRACASRHIGVDGRRPRSAFSASCEVSRSGPSSDVIARHRSRLRQAWRDRQRSSGRAAIRGSARTPPRCRSWQSAPTWCQESRAGPMRRVLGYADSQEFRLKGSMPAREARAPLGHARAGGKRRAEAADGIDTLVWIKRRLQFGEVLVRFLVKPGGPDAR